MAEEVGSEIIVLVKKTPNKSETSINLKKEHGQMTKGRSNACGE